MAKQPSSCALYKKQGRIAKKKILAIAFRKRILTVNSGVISICGNLSFDDVIQSWKL